jgi:hypothetical protein
VTASGSMHAYASSAPHRHGCAGFELGLQAMVAALDVFAVFCENKPSFLTVLKRCVFRGRETAQFAVEDEPQLLSCVCAQLLCLARRFAGSYRNRSATIPISGPVRVAD